MGEVPVGQATETDFTLVESETLVADLNVRFLSSGELSEKSLMSSPLSALFATLTPVSPLMSAGPSPATSTEPRLLSLTSKPVSRFPL